MKESSSSRKITKSTRPVRRQRWVSRRWHDARQWIASERLRRVRTYLFQGYVLAALVAFAALALLANTTPIFQPDVRITQFLQDELPPWMNLVLEAVSWPGYGPQTVIITAAIIGSLAIIGLRWEAIATFLVAFAAVALNLIVKTAVARPRPSADLVHVYLTLKDFSFPSGHVMFYTAFFGFLLFLSFTLLKRSWPRYLVNTLLILLIGLIGISRMYLGEHWASDVLGGYLLGSLVLIFGIILYRWGKDRYLVRQPVAQESAAAPVPHEEKKEIKEALKNPMMVDKAQVKKEVKQAETKEANHEENHPDRPAS